jgi:hypothetical protein
MKKEKKNLNPSQHLLQLEKNRFDYLSTKVEIREIYKKYHSKLVIMKKKISSYSEEMRTMKKKN